MNTPLFRSLGLGLIFFCLSLTEQSKAADGPLVAQGHKEWNVRDYGATGQGIVKDTSAIQAAIHAASQAGGGIVRIPAGCYLSGTINLENGITVHLDKGAMLIGSTDLTDYPEHPSPVPASNSNIEFGRYALVWADGVHDVGLEGDGMINGQGENASFDIGKNVKKGLSIAEAVRRRPFLVAFTQCKNVHVTGLTLLNSAYWVEDYLDCDHVVVEGLTVQSRVNANNDGIDIDGSRDVKASNCNITSGDDGVCLKATYGDCEHVHVENCRVSSGCNGLKCGTSSIGGYKDITFTNCLVYDTGLSGVALEIVDGGTMDGVVVQGITMWNLGAPFFIRLGDRHRDWVDRPKPFPIGQVRNIELSNIIASNCGHNRHSPAILGCAPIGASITGLPGHNVEGVTLTNIRLRYLGGGTEKQAQIKASDIPEVSDGYPEHDMFHDLPSYGIYCRHVDGLTMNQVDMDYEQLDGRPAVVCHDVQNLKQVGVRDHGVAIAQ